MLFRRPIPLALCFLLSGVAWAQPETEVELTLRNCNKIEASAILGVNATGCLTYDLKKQEATTTIEVCGGLMLKVALKEVVIGGELGHEKIGRVTIKTVLNPGDSKAALDLLKSTSPQGDELRRLTLGRVKGMLTRAKDADLKELGISRDQVDGLGKLRFESPKDRTDRRDQIRKLIDRCPVMGVRGIS